MNQRSKPIEVLIRPSLSVMGEVKHEVTTAKALKTWTVNVLVNGKVNQSQRTHSESDLALATRTMLRTEHLLGNFSSYTRAATQGTGTRPKLPGSPGKQLRPIEA